MDGSSARFVVGDKSVTSAAAAGTDRDGLPAARSGGAVAGRKGAVPIGTAPHHPNRGTGGADYPSL